MANPANHGVLTGRVGKGGIKSFKNGDGSLKLVFSLGVRENFLRAGKNEADTNFIPVTVFIPAQANGMGSWGNVHEGDLVSVAFRLRYRPWTTKDGETHYPEGATVEVDGYPVFLEPKSVTSARAAKKATEAGAPTAEQPVAEQPAPNDQAAQIAALQEQIAALGGAAATPFGA